MVPVVGVRRVGERSGEMGGSSVINGGTDCCVATWWVSVCGWLTSTLTRRHSRRARWDYVLVSKDLKLVCYTNKHTGHESCTCGRTALFGDSANERAS